MLSLPRITPPTKKRSCRTYPEYGAGTVEYVIVLIVAVAIGAGLLGFGTKIAQQVNETGDTIGGWFGSGEDVFGAGSADKAETAFAVYSADDNSLDFYKRAEVPEVGDKFEFKTVTEVYTGFETGTYTHPVVECSECSSTARLCNLSIFPASISLQSLVPTKCSVIANRCPKSVSVLIGNGSSMTMVREQIPICRLLLQNISVGQTASGIAFRLARDTRRKTFRITRLILM